MASSLDLLQFQPIRFGFEPETCANNDNKAYCKLVQDGDNISWQVRRKFGTSLGCDLSTIDTTNVTLNAEFTGSAFPWTLTGGWSWDAGGFVKIAGGTGTVSQSIVGFVDNAIYQIKVTTIITTTGDDLTVSLSGVAVGNIPVGSVAGTYYFYGVGDIGTNTISISGTAITTRVDSIYMYRAAPCFTVDVVSGTFAYDPSTGFAINGTVNMGITLQFETSLYYSPKTTLTISGYQSGTIDTDYDGDSTGAFTASNGQTSFSLNGSNYTDLGISFIDFIGNIDSIDFQQLSSDYYFSLNDLDGNFISSLNYIALTYCKDYIVGNFSPQDQGFPYGCYRIGLYDPFLHTDQYEFSYDFTTLGVNWSETGNNWTLTGGIGYEFDAASNTFAYIHTNEVTTSGLPYQPAWTKFKFETGTLSGAGIGSTGASVYLVDPDIPQKINEYGVTPASDHIYQSPIEGSPTGVEFGANVQPWLEISGALMGSHFEFKNAFYKVYPYHQDYLSNCFTYQQSIPCTKMFYANAGNNLGFNMNNCPFSITQRFRIVRITPTYKIAANDFIGSDGTRVLVSGTMQKFSTFLFDYMDEVAHDVVAAIIMSKEVFVADDFASITIVGKRYFVLPQDYTPEYDDKDGKYNLSRGRIEVMEYDQVKTVTNCE